MCKRKAIESSFSTDRSSTRYLGSACRHHFVVIHVDDAGTFQKERENERARAAERMAKRCLRLRKIHVRGKRTVNLDVKSIRVSPRRFLFSSCVPCIVIDDLRRRYYVTFHPRGQFLERIRQNGASYFRRVEVPL